MKTTRKAKVASPKVTSLKARVTEIAQKAEQLDKFTSSAWSAEVYKMSPKEAQLILLERNCNKGIDATNRNLKPRNVKFLGRAISEGSWKRHAGNIKFDVTGTMIDGQHRLNAIAQSNEDVEVILEKGCDKGTTQAIDQGDNRTLTHAVQFGGELGKITPAQVGWMTLRTVGVLRSLYDVDGKVVPEGTLSERSKGYSARLVVDTFNNNKAALMYLYGNRSSKKGYSRPAVLSPITSFMTRNPEKGKEFYNEFIGASLNKSESNAARMLAKHLDTVNEKKANGEALSLGIYSSRGYDEMVYWYKQTLRAIEAFENGENIRYAL
jgi:hypothetical protein|tara:strand:- start:192 stop:1160 length:969 start_codon:yes stop_codon:yes gene_type:complete